MNDLFLLVSCFGAVLDAGEAHNLSGRSDPDDRRVSCRVGRVFGDFDRGHGSTGCASVRARRSYSVLYPRETTWLGEGPQEVSRKPLPT